MVNVSLVVYYTEQFAGSTGDVQGTIDNLVNDANQAYRNTRVPLALRLHCARQISNSESSDADSRLNEFKYSQGND